MVSQNKKFCGFIPMVLTMMIFLAYYKVPLFDSAYALFDTSYDGLKNYYTFGYFISHGNGLGFNGMAFPRGVHAIFADTQPIFSFPLQILNRYFPCIGEHSVTIVNWMMVLGISLSSYFYYKIFRHAKVAFYWATCFAVIGALLSPQIWRMSWHHALAYGFVIPSMIWLHICSKQVLRKRILFSVWVLFLALIHPYYLAMYGLYFGALFLIEAYNKSSLSVKEAGLFCLPFLFYAAIIWIVDLPGDRPQSPYGFFAHRALVKDLFLPYCGLFSEGINYLFPSSSLKYSEGSSYPGLIGITGLVLTFMIYINRKTRGSEPYFGSYFLALVPIVLFSLQIPFMWFGEHIVGSIPIIQQFRGTGRFSWFFYNVVFIFGLIHIYQYAVGKYAPRVVHIALTLLAALSIVEVHGNLSNSLGRVMKDAGPNSLKENTLVVDALRKGNYDYSRVDGIITVPPATFGSGKLWLYDHPHVQQNVWPFSFQTGIPMVSFNLSRVPISITAQTLSLTCNKFASRKNTGLNLDSEFLIFIVNTYKEEYLDIIDKSDFITSTEWFNIYSATLRSLERPWLPCSTLIRKMPFYESNIPYVFEPFDSTGDGGLTGGAMKVKENEFEVRFVLDDRDRSETLDISYWNELNIRRGGIIRCSYEEEQDGEWEVKERFRETDMSRFEVMGNWVRYSKKITPSEMSKSCKLRMVGRNLNIDNVMIRDASDTIMFHQNGFININNYLVECQ